MILWNDVHRKSCGELGSRRLVSNDTLIMQSVLFGTLQSSLLYIYVCIYM